MNMVDIKLLFNPQQQISEIEWCNQQLAVLYAAEWQFFCGQTLAEISALNLDQAQQTIDWKQERFSYHEIDTPTYHCLLLKKYQPGQQLFEFALNQINKGIQLYDQNACVVYVNKQSREISAIPNHLQLSGKHLLDLYDVKEDISTVMTTLRTRAPVIDRFDQFQSTEGHDIASINTAYPVFQQQQLIGAVVFEQNRQSIEQQIVALQDLKSQLEEKKAQRSLSRFHGYQFADLIGQSRSLLESVDLAKRIAIKACNVLLVGETGTGKEIFAQSIHKASSRSKKRFVAINCAAVPETLIESLFFGTCKGSFTGSVDKAGLLEEADGGTLFLDELNSMSLSTQSKILRVIQEGVMRRVGGNKDILVDIRFISSTNQQPSELIEDNLLRKDLFYRLSSVTIDIPPLRQRCGDVELLVDFYISKNIDKYTKPINGICPQVMAFFTHYHWPGNVRELFNVLDYILNTMEGDRIELKHLPKYLFPQGAAGETDSPAVNVSSLPELKGNLVATLQQVEKQLIEALLVKYRYNISRAAIEAGLSRQNLQYRIKKLAIGGQS